ncbi:hypothetical protein KFL_007380100 [Klebsormidium nitens]|uniref:Uncharacterized protein n=1 Tax=Klebsormidium nitens TaxID=105231 RepID=A0A1Y1IJY4_KLENI|nr:hypothetical protein KFL_007380100 [Klebsormidium nitens]|eukprot:GAQ91175.1 hypothetical protein KFL_007380100 [Klebsormidium nitens]
MRRLPKSQPSQPVLTHRLGASPRLCVATTAAAPLGTVAAAAPAAAKLFFNDTRGRGSGAGRHALLTYVGNGCFS